MEQSRKEAASTSNNKNLSASLDDDFGKDFLSSWKLSKLGKDTIGFDVEAVPKNSKKFSFDKLDDFELDGAFDKLSSFKMDMPDLDFSSPLKKNVKHNDSAGNEFLRGKDEPKQDSFSFTFDFNDLGKFNLDTKLGIGEKDTGKFTDNIDSSCSTKDGKDPQRGCMGNYVPQAKETKELSKAQGVSTSKRANMTGKDTARIADHSISILNSADFSHKTQDFNKMHATMPDKNGLDTDSGGKHGQHSDGTTKPDVEKSAQDISLISGDGLAQVATFPEKCKEVHMIQPPKINQSKGRDNCEQSVTSSHSRSTSPVNSHNPRRLAAQSESPTHQNEVVEEGSSRDGASQGNQIVRSISVKFLQNRSYRKKDTGESSSPNHLPSQMQRECKNAKTTAVKEKGSSSLLCKSLNMAANREHKQVNGQDENSKIGLLKSNNKPALQALSATSVNDKDDKKGTSSLQHLEYNLPGAITPGSTANSAGHDLVFSYAPLRSTKTSLKVQGSSLKDEKRMFFSDLTGPRIAKADGKSPSSPLHLDRKSAKVSENKVAPINTTFSKPNSDFEGNHALLSPPLKRKILEESAPDPKALNPLKRIMMSSVVRKSPESTPKMGNGTVLVNGNPKICADHVVSSSGLQKMGDISELELPILVENDGNVEKAEACRKDLEDLEMCSIRQREICSMLRRKHEEAKELLVRAVVNNNNMLMLNHPMFEEKIRALQKFAITLSSKEYSF